MTEQEFHQLIEEHYRKHRKDLVRKFSGRVRGRTNAEDVVQEAYARALQYQDSYDGKKGFDNWFNTILRNAANDFNKEERARGQTYSNMVYDMPGPDPKSYRHILSQIIEKINKKPEDIRQILTLYFLDQYTQKEIEQVSVKSRKAIENIVLRFRKEIKDAYGQRI